jgi:putative DNA primase/helicase
VVTTSNYQIRSVSGKGGRVISAADIHARIDWPTVLLQLGVPEAVLRNKHGPCPACGGKDRFRFDNKRGRGDYICGQCGAGDGFKLLERVHGWTFSESRQQVITVAGLEPNSGAHRQAPTPRQVASFAQAPAQPPDRVNRLRRDRCPIENCDDAVDYLASRDLWPLPSGCTLRAHATVEYWDEGNRIGRYPAILADVLDVTGDLVTVHTTYLQGGKKLTGYEARKILSPLSGREGCAVRLMPATDVLGIAEGIETALSAAVIDSIPVWAALNTSLLAKFEPPPGVLRLRIYADGDSPGLAAATHLMERLQGRVALEVRIPSAPAKDWNDVLSARNSRISGEGNQ